MTKIQLLFVLITLFPVIIYSSSGDQNQDFIECKQKCLSCHFTCGKPDLEDAQYSFYEPNPLISTLFFWDWESECNYQCMQLIEKFKPSNATPVKYFGKWVFNRIVGIQEVASVIFSIGNLLANYYGYAKFITTVDIMNEEFKIYRYYHYINQITWICSSLFHSRDVFLTQCLDYAFALASIMCATYISIIRTFFRNSPEAQYYIAEGFFIYWLYHNLNLIFVDFDFKRNLVINVGFIIAHGLVLVLWRFLYGQDIVFVEKIDWFLFLSLISFFLAILDFPPLFKLIDSHALWHASTILPCLIYWTLLTQELSTPNYFKLT